MLGIPLTTRSDHSSIKSMACSSSCPELSEHVSYTLHKLQMTDITLRAEECSAMEAIYNRQNVFVWLPTNPRGRAFSTDTDKFVFNAPR